jgi:cytochrome o ubiquinol oxidase operon protein cyoD
MTPLTKYIVGYVLSFFLTFGAAALVFFDVMKSGPLFSPPIVLALLIALAFLQFLVQLILFLHLGEKQNSGSPVVLFLVTLFTVGALAVGTLWIMQHLEHNEHTRIPFREGVVTPQTELK